MKIKITLSVFLTVALYASGLCQDIHFSGYTESPLLLNPALAGSAQTPYRATLVYRNQWVTVGKAYNTAAVSFDFPLLMSKSRLPKPFLGLGVTVYRDAAGDAGYGTTSFGLTASGNVPIAEQHRIAAGIQTHLGQKSADISSLEWGSQYINGVYNPLATSGESDRLSSKMYTDIAWGLYYQFTNNNENFMGDDVIKAYAGFSFYHANKPELIYFSEVTQKIYSKKILTLGGSIDLPNSKFAVLPNFMYLNQGPSKETTFGAMVRLKLEEGTKFTGFNIQKSFGIGAQIRLGDAVIPQVMFQRAGWQFSFSYDVNISKLTASSKTVGAFELAAKFTAPRKGNFKRR